MGRKDPVKKNMDLLHKPVTHRNRKRESKNNPPVDHDTLKPQHRPYERTKDWQKELDDAEDIFREDLDEQ